MMKINTRNNTKIIKQIKDTIISLQNKKYITEIYNFDGENIILDKNTFFYAELIEPPEERYFMVYDSDIDKIFTYLKSSNISKFDFVRYYLACKRVTNNDSEFGYLAQSKLKQLISDTRTVGRYNKILQDDLELFKFNSNYLTAEKHYCTTFVGAYNNKSFDKMVQDEANNRGLVPTDKTKANKKRSLKQKIYNINNSDDKDARIQELEEKLKQYESMQYKNKNEQKEKDDQEISDLVDELNLDIQIFEDDIPESTKITKQLTKDNDDYHDK